MMLYFTPPPFPSNRLGTPLLHHLIQPLVHDREILAGILIPLLLHHRPIHLLRQLTRKERGINGLGGGEGEDEVLVCEVGEETVCVAAVGGG